MKKIKSLSLSLIATIAISGCGGGGSSNSGVAYYHDSAVEGVEYICGSKSGVTNKDGGFIYESGKNCQMKLANLTLRDIPPTQLSNEAIIIEDNPKVAAFLQSLDIDGDPDNGITINKEEVEALKSIIKEERISTIPTGTELEVVVAELHNRAPHYNGHAVDEHSAMEHVNRHKEELKQHHQVEASHNQEHQNEHANEANHNNEHQNEHANEAEHEHKNEHANEPNHNPEHQTNPITHNQQEATHNQEHANEPEHEHKNEKEHKQEHKS